MQSKRTEGSPTPTEPIGGIGDASSKSKCYRLPIHLDKEVRFAATMFNESKDQIVEKAVSQYVTHNKVRQACIDHVIEDPEICKCHEV